LASLVYEKNTARQTLNRLILLMLSMLDCSRIIIKLRMLHASEWSYNSPELCFEIVIVLHAIALNRGIS
jgi:hypothetical protein